MEPVNNFPNAKAQFKKDTGLDADTNMALYIQYFNSMVTDALYQTNSRILTILKDIATAGVKTRTV